MGASPPRLGTYVAGHRTPALRRAADAALVPEIRTHVRGTERVIDLQAARRPEQYPAAASGPMHFAMVGDRLAASAAARLGVADPAS